MLQLCPGFAKFIDYYDCHGIQIEKPESYSSFLEVSFCCTIIQVCDGFEVHIICFRVYCCVNRWSIQCEVGQVLQEAWNFFSISLQYPKKRNWIRSMDYKEILPASFKRHTEEILQWSLHENWIDVVARWKDQWKTLLKIITNMDNELFSTELNPQFLIRMKSSLPTAPEKIWTITS